MMHHNLTDNAGDSQHEGRISVLKKKKSVTRCFKNQLARSGLGFYFPVRLFFQQQTCHLSLLVHGIEPTIESKGEQTFYKTVTETRASSNSTWLDRKSRSLVTCSQKHKSLISTDQSCIQGSMSYMLLYYSYIPLLAPDCHFTDQTLLSAPSALDPLHPVRME